jgi:endonuclease III
MGSFTSILDRTQLSQISSTIVTDSAAIVASLTYIPSEISGYYTSSLSPTIVMKYTQDFSNAVNFMTSHETADKTFYKNLKDMMAKYNSTKQYVNMGDSESYLINNFIGTPKLISRVNS